MRKTKASLFPNEYHIWQSMKARCSNKNDKFFESYGGRGISVCPEWIKDFERFLCDMSPRPSREFLLDRINNDGNYESSNCRWSSRSESAINTRLRKDNKTGHKGIYYRSDNKKYRAILYRNKSQLNIGHFASLKEAIKAYEQYT